MSYGHPFGMTCEDRDDLIRDYEHNIWLLRTDVAAMRDHIAELERLLRAREEHCRRVHGCTAAW